MNIALEDKKIKDIKSDIEIVLVIDNNQKHKWVKDTKELKIQNFSAKEGESIIIDSRLYIGVDSFEHDDIRISCANAIKILRDKNYKSAKVGLYLNGCTSKYVRAMVDGFVLGAYSFDKYKSEKIDAKLKNITISNSEYSDKKFNLQEAKDAVKKAIIVSNSTNLTRDIVNTTPEDLTPIAMSKLAKKIAKENGYECIIEDEKYLEQNGMGAMLAVSRASVHKPRLIHLAYKPKKAIAKITLVGKGLTYDSGGLSLKPSDYMVTMKSDKSGGSAVLGIMNAVKELNLPIEVHGIIGAVENMIGGNAYKPDDILIAKNGKSIEIRNTDAEGRLVLADCLVYAQERVEADYIFDIATLTGACVVALGEYTTGIMGHSNALKHKMTKAARSSGELVGTLSFNKYLKKTIKSQIADICNISSTRYGGAITAGMFLDNFIKDKNRDKWLHLDIAGPAYVEKAWGYNPYGASGAGVRMVLKFMEQLTQEG